MNLDQDHVIHLVNGRLREGGVPSKTKKADVDRIVEAALASGPTSHLVIHFHGGLVSAAAGRAIAAKLSSRYAQAGRYPVFFVWESGFLESVRNNLGDIARDPLFRELVKKVSRWVLTQLPAGVGFKGAGGTVDVGRLEGEFDEWFAGKRSSLPEALSGQASQAVLKGGSVVEPSEADLRLKIQMQLGPDAEFQNTLKVVQDSITAESLAHPTPKTDATGRLVSPLSEVAPEQVGDVMDVQQGKGFLSLAKISLFIAGVVVAVIRRLLRGRSHGLYPTIVEEILAGLYVDKIGGVLWGQMKKDTSDAFGDSAICGGSALIEAISAQQAAGKAFNRITLIGHSTGAIYICNLIDYAASRLPSTAFEVVFLAPAVTYSRMATTLQQHAARIARFRMFAMHDDVESADQLVPFAYTRSLLYFVSGLVEFQGVSRTADEPLLGMERFLLEKQTFAPAEFPAIAAVEAFLKSHPKSVAWSKTANGSASGEKTESMRHGDFDDDPVTLDSLAHVLAQGF